MIPAQVSGDFALNLWVFVLSSFLGLQLIRGVSRLLHTPLMSLTNAISSIAIIASLIIAAQQETTMSTILGSVAVACSATNAIGGFLITDRILQMFRSKEAAKK